MTTLTVPKTEYYSKKMIQAKNWPNLSLGFTNSIFRHIKTFRNPAKDYDGNDFNPKYRNDNQSLLGIIYLIFKYFNLV